MEEYKAVQRNIKTDKAAGREGISPEVLKYCDSDETVLQFANKLLMNLARQTSGQKESGSHTEKR